jgi:hypothetical protein
MMTADEATSIVGPIDERIVADIVASGASIGELSKAWFWLNADESLIGAGLPSPSGKVAELIDILAADTATPFNGGLKPPPETSSWPGYL